MQKEKEIEEQQLDMGFKEPLSNKLRKIKYKIEMFFMRLKTNSLLKSPPLWIFSSLTASLLFVQYYYYHNYFTILPREIPLFVIRENLEFRLVQNHYLLPVLIFSLVLTIVSLIIAIKIYYRFRPLSILILGNMFVSIFLITIAFIRIFGIYIF
jgi:hypothetical protein